MHVIEGSRFGSIDAPARMVGPARRILASVIPGTETVSADVLTTREEQTLALIAAGLSNKRIARELGIADGTVKVYVKSLLRKLRFGSRLELAAWFHRQSRVGTPGEGLLDDLPGLIYRGGNHRLWPMEYISAGCLALTGYPADYLTDTLRHSYGRLILDEHVDYVWLTVQRALSERRAYQLDYRIRCADGCVRRVWENGVGIYAANGEVLGVEGAIFAIAGKEPLDAGS